MRRRLSAEINLFAFLQNTSKKFRSLEAKHFKEV
jgi:hypothetical protein